MKLVSIPAKEATEEQTSAALQPKKLQRKIDRIRSPSARPDDALAADALSMLLRIASMTRDTNKQKALVQSIEFMTRAIS